MCGIAGVFAPHKLTPNRLKDALGIMSETLLHRGPDSHDTWLDENLQGGLCHRRLAIVDLSPAGNQPMASQCGRYILCYNGEMYIANELRMELSKKGHTFRGHSDTEVIVQACVQWGVVEATKRLVGEFAFALWDTHTRTLACVRDRLGVKPLYWAYRDGMFGFSSEISALMRTGLYETTINPQALNAYLTLGYVPEPLSIYTGVFKLNPGEILTYSLGKEPTCGSYWDFHALANKEPDGSIPYSQAKNQVHKLLKNAVRGRMMSDVPLGSLLSGGIDSSLVTAILQEYSASPVKTFTIGFEEQGFNEAIFARDVARHLGTDHHEHYVTSMDARNIIPDLPGMYGEPFSDSSAIPTFLVSKLAKTQVTVTLSGDGGDEIFGGYSRYDYAQRIAGYMKILSFPKAVGWFLEKIPTALIPTWLGKSYATRLNRLGFILRSSPSHLPLHLVQQWVVGEILSPEWISSYHSMYEQKQHNDLIPSFMIADTLQYLPGDILTKVDRASMAVSLESRIPLLDHRLVEYAWTLPQTYKRQAGGSKRILRDILAHYIPKHLIERPKMGFGVPMGEWLKNDLHAWSRDLLTSDTAKLYFHHDRLMNTFDQHVSGAVNNPYRLWNILSFVSWHKSHH
ncbi:MAG: asparagine synthase (glutamine-hydrolyzing) [Alphaproteobacteria bacterium]|nr:MAG: asparagine synthase (glutamine-hydrolyzing) [Alphaproteobacteria bacterium]